MTTTDAPHTALDGIVREGRAAIAAAASLDALDEAVARLFGKRGALTGVKRELGRLDEAERRTLGRRVNAAYGELEPLVAERRAVLADERDRVALAREAVDVTLPPRAPRRGRPHPIPETIEAIVDIFVGLGYTPVFGPEVESDQFNFVALNYQPDHPARSLHDTIYVRALDDEGSTGSTLLRTHTSPVQVRTMLAAPPPVFVVVPGRVYRQDTPDATHLPVFHQIEGLAVAEGLTMADLRGTLSAFARALLGPETRTRLRPHYFPFTEPSGELDAWVDGRWVELLGCGMVHPNVLRMAGYDPEAVSGFAFGIGVERVAMSRYGVNDLRLLAENDLRFLAF